VVRQCVLCGTMILRRLHLWAVIRLPLLYFAFLTLRDSTTCSWQGSTGPGFLLLQTLSRTIQHTTWLIRLHNHRARIHA
jgi:hypothetical protein